MTWATAKTKGYTLKAGSATELRKKIEEAVGRQHRCHSQGVTKISPEKTLYWAKMTL